MSIIFTFLAGHILDRFMKLLLLKTVRWHILIRVDSMARITNFLLQPWLLVEAIIIILILRKIIFTQRMRFLNIFVSSVVLTKSVTKKIITFHIALIMSHKINRNFNNWLFILVTLFLNLIFMINKCIIFSIFFLSILDRKWWKLI